MWLSILVAVLVAYFLGNLNGAVCMSVLIGNEDVRKKGSGNAGTTNMLRVLGRRAAIPVFALDFLKGFVAVTIIDLVKYDDVFANAPNENWFYMLRFAALFCAVLGHIFPIFAGFRGGKGVATLVGGVVAVNAPLVLLCAGVWIIVLMVTHYVSLASMIAGVCYPIFTLTSPKVGHLPPFIIFSLVVAILLIYTHRKNIQRLKAGTESKIYVWKRKQQADVAAPNETEESIEEAIEELVEEFQEDNKEA